LRSRSWVVLTGLPAWSAIPPRRLPCLATRRKRPFRVSSAPAALARSGLAVGGGTLRRLLRHPSGQHEVLLGDLNEVRRRPVHDEAGREDEAPDAEQQRHDLRQRLLL